MPASRGPRSIASGLGQLVPALALPAHRLMLGEALQALDDTTARRDRLTDHIACGCAIAGLVRAARPHALAASSARSAPAEIGISWLGLAKPARIADLDRPGWRR